jgi:hypothetical protein
MRAQIRELIRPAVLLAGVLVFARPSAAAGLSSGFVAHTNQEHHLLAHTNQDGAIRRDALHAVNPASPAGMFAGLEAGIGCASRPAAAVWVPRHMPIDAGAAAPADTRLGLGAPELPADTLAPGDPGVAGVARGGAIPAPGGLSLLALPVLVARRKRRREAPPRNRTGRHGAAGSGRAGRAGRS